jgi:ketosteroid isomerase-like protein
MEASKNPEDIVREFINCINEHDNDAIFALSSPDFVFVDSGGSSYQRSQMEWNDYFKMFPDYTIHIEDILIKDSTVVILGSFSQTYAVDGKLPEENFNSVPAVWRAEVKDGLVSFWQVYTDHTRTWEIINRNKDRGSGS